MNSKYIPITTVIFGIIIQIGAYFISSFTENDLVISITTILFLIGGITLVFIKKYKPFAIGLLICSGINIIVSIWLLILISSLH